MFTLKELSVPVVQAPMAGGPSTVELAIAVSNAGALGFLAGGYITPEQCRHNILTYQKGSAAPFGVNLFVPEAVRATPADISSYATHLASLAQELDIPAPRYEDVKDSYQEQLADYRTAVNNLMQEPVPVVSFTFGLPSSDVIAGLNRAGTAVFLTVTSEAEAQAALDLHPQGLVVQGYEAGGHRGTHDQSQAPNASSTQELVRCIRAGTSAEIIAAGGVGTAADVRQLLAAGADAVAVGTLFLTAHEAGTKALHRQALLRSDSAETVTTRVFSGRVARAIDNAFIRRMTSAEVIGYPEVHFLTSPLRKAAADADGLNLWAGMGYRNAFSGSAEEIIESLRP